ncbi:RNA-directed DNA polymerase, eukaryota [Tanacetum coccineum]|uniref:RNA-directed DNA polymerase, eukaryota n=1 Tax=Tanacetum coccineum TaxID=301880 RepID=A0ABQ5BDT2_9ASTR
MLPLPKTLRTPVDRDLYGAHDRLVVTYFGDNSVLDQRLPFVLIAEKVGITTLMNFTSTIRQLAYNVVPDWLDKYLQIGDKTSRGCLGALSNTYIPATISSAPAMVIDDSCVVKRDLQNHVMGEVKQFSLISNLRNLLLAEGFHIVNLAYIGGLWVIVELESSKVKSKFMKHVGVGSWFSRLCDAQSDFVSRDRIVWVDIEGVPLHAWSRSTFVKIGSKWGEVMEMEENKDDMFARKRICIKTSQEDNILDKFKIIVKGKVFVVRAKELFTWSPVFKDDTEDGYCTKDESVKAGEGAEKNVGNTDTHSNLEAESDVEAVSDTYFGDHDDKLEIDQNDVHSVNDKETSTDPFGLYDLLKKRNKGVDNSGLERSFPYPQGLTPEVVQQTMKNQGRIVLIRLCPVSVRRTKGGFKIRVLDGLARWVHYNWGFSMDGCLESKAKKDWIRELNIKYKVSFLTLQETKTDSISTMEVKCLWGNYQFEHLASDAIGNSGGILCTWDPNVFRKDHHIISDNFVALYGTWIPSKSNLLIISVYAPQSITDKRSLWSYITSLITRWNGECMVMGDFNEVRIEGERMGSIFNAKGANEFNNFISNSGLVEIQLEGYAFTWSHPSAAKMSKLDRFLVTEGLLSLFPHISALCLMSRYGFLSDHRPILLRSSFFDYGATPFRLYHSWLNLQGFAQMKLQILKKEIKIWIADFNKKQSSLVNNTKDKLHVIDNILDQGGVSDDLLLSRLNLMKQLQDIKTAKTCDFMQKAKVRWAIEGDENSKFFHGVINKKRVNLSIKGIDCTRKVGITTLMNFTSTIRQLAYNVVPDWLDKYLQIGDKTSRGCLGALSKGLVIKTSRDCLDAFYMGVMQLYGEEYLRKPTQTDVEQLYVFHEEKHGFSKILGSIDCTKWPWAQCPTA